MPWWNFICIVWQFLSRSWITQKTSFALFKGIKAQWVSGSSFIQCCTDVCCESWGKAKELSLKLNCIKEERDIKTYPKFLFYCSFMVSKLLSTTLYRNMTLLRYTYLMRKHVFQWFNDIMHINVVSLLLLSIVNNMTGHEKATLHMYALILPNT